MTRIVPATMITNRIAVVMIVERDGFFGAIAVN